MKWFQRCAAIAMGLTLAACGGSDNDSSPPNATIRISHLAPDANWLAAVIPPLVPW